MTVISNQRAHFVKVKERFEKCSCLQVTQGRHGEVIAGAPHHAAHHYSDGFDHVSGSEELHRPASYMVRDTFLDNRNHIHFYLHMPSMSVVSQLALNELNENASNLKRQQPC